MQLDEAKLDKNGNRNPADLAKVTTFGYGPLIDKALQEHVAALGIETSFTKPKQFSALLSSSAAADVRNHVLAHPETIGTTVEFRILATSRVDGYLKGRVTRDSVARDKSIDAEHLDLVDALRAQGSIVKGFNWDFISGADASESRPEQAGMGVAMLGSFFMMLVVLALSLPIGVAASIYLEEFAGKNRFNDLIEVNISNLAAVPSIVFGILGLAVFIQFAHLPQSAPLVGGLVLTLMTLPTIIICNPRVAQSRAALDPRCGPWGRGLEDAIDLPPCLAACDARHPDRHHHRPRSGIGRNRAASVDRHGRLHRLELPHRDRRRLPQSELRDACADLRMGKTRRSGLL